MAESPRSKVSRLTHDGHGRVSASAKRSRCGGRLFVIPRRVQHAVGLEVALEAGEHERPAFADRIEHLAAFGEIVVRDGKLDLILLPFEIDSTFKWTSSAASS